MKFSKTMVYLAAFLQYSIVSHADELINRAKITESLDCRPHLVSYFNGPDESGKTEAKKTYEGLLFTRTDALLNNPDGHLIVSNVNGDSVIGDIPLSVNHSIYYSAEKKILLLSNNSGSYGPYLVYKMEDSNLTFEGHTDESATDYLYEMFNQKPEAQPTMMIPDCTR